MVRFVANDLETAIDLLQQDDGLLGQPAAEGRDGDMGGQPGLPGLGGDGRGNDCGTVPVPGVVLNDQDRTDAPLLTAHHGTQVGIKNISSFYAVIHKSSHSAV